MIDFMKLLNNDTSNLSESERAQVEMFTNSLKEKLIDELVKYEADELIKKLEKDKEDFVESIGQNLINGCRGYKNMSMQLLLDIYLEKIGSESFISLIENLK